MRLLELKHANTEGFSGFQCIHRLVNRGRKGLADLFSYFFAGHKAVRHEVIICPAR